MEKKILILANSDVGLYNFRKELISELFQQGYKVYISLPDGNNIEKLCEMGCVYLQTDVDRRGKNPIKDGQLFLKYVKMIRKVKPTVILTYTVKPNLYGGIASRLCKVPYICNVTGLGSGFLNGGITQKIIKILATISFQNAKRVMVQNSADLHQLIDKKITENNLTLIPGSGVNLEEFRQLPYPNPDLPIEFLFIARVMKDKGIDEYLEAAKKIIEKYNNVKFHVIGAIEEDRYQLILDELEKVGIVKYHGFQKNISSFIKNSHCTINPSYTEGMSNVLLESAACGRPVIASNISGCMEIIDEGVSGLVFEVKNSNSLTKAIEKFIQLDYFEKKIMGKNGRNKMEKEFNRSIVIDEYLKEIKNV